MSVIGVCKQEISKRRVLVRRQITASSHTPAKKHKATDHVRRFGWNISASVGSLWLLDEILHKIFLRDSYPVDKVVVAYISKLMTERKAHVKLIMGIGYLG